MTLAQDLNVTCKLLDYTLDSSSLALDLSKRSFSQYSFPLDQVQTVYRLLARAEPAALERLCVAIKAVDPESSEWEKENLVYNWNYGVSFKRKEAERSCSSVLVYNSYSYSTLEGMVRLRQVVLHGLADNHTLSILGEHCPLLQLADITGSGDVTDVGIQNLVFPPAIQKAGRVNLVNTRARSNLIFIIIRSLV